MESQSSLTQMLYAQLQDEALAYSVAIFEQGVTGSPYINTSGGHEYVYWQIRQLDGTLRCASLGRNSPETQAIVAKLLERKKTATELIDALKLTTRSFVGSGGMDIENSHFKILETLARGGLFSKGVVLVGSHAFAAIGNMLGVRWGDKLKTTDMDFARPSGIALAIPDAGGNINIPDTVKQDDPSFFEIPQLSRKQPSTSMMSSKSKVKIDFLTVQKNAIDTSPHYFSDLGIAADPLKYMDYLLGGESRQGLIIGNYAIPVNLPDPARLAIHKLVIAQERTLSFETKSQKDIRQASELIDALSDLGHEQNIRLAISDLIAIGSNKPLENIKKSMNRMEQNTRSVLETEWKKALMGGLLVPTL
ncbi:GSU2403 family nucleotidyltransferase fold protein [Propionivibrio sp.]|uniref:GSU2403 family nucleotidyltransferase fold protein n=1 Tax=Propionivibrio sp. TaxID=2212460 RepID=UPI003BEFCA8F